MVVGGIYGTASTPPPSTHSGGEGGRHRGDGSRRRREEPFCEPRSPPVNWGPRSVWPPMAGEEPGSRPDELRARGSQTAATGTRSPVPPHRGDLERCRAKAIPRSFGSPLSSNHSGWIRV